VQGLKLVADMTINHASASVGAAEGGTRQGGVISGADAFKLYVRSKSILNLFLYTNVLQLVTCQWCRYDSLGFPADLTCLVAKQVGWDVDMKGFDTAMQQQRERARLHWNGSGDAQLPADVRYTYRTCYLSGHISQHNCRAWSGRIEVQPMWHVTTRIDCAKVLQVADVGGASTVFRLPPICAPNVDNYF
jgi:hypothetical protein